MSIGQNIKKYREAFKLTQDELAKIVGVSNKAVSTWENDLKVPRMGTIQKMADYFNIKKSNLIETEPEEQSNVKGTLNNVKVRMIPVYESVSAGFGAYVDSTVIDYMPINIANEYEAKNTICITVKGDSMSPKIDDGDIIQVLKQDSVNSGDFAVILIDGEEGFVKRINYGKDWIELVSINPYYPPRMFEGRDVERISVVGKVKRVIKNL